MLRAAAAQAQQLVLVPESTAATDLIVLLDRITGLAALALDLRRSIFMGMAVQTLLDLYGWAVEDLRVHTSAHRLVPVLWLRIAERLYALGALAVRLKDWTVVRKLAVAPVPELIREHRSRTWHRDALTQTSRAGLFTEQQPGGNTRELSLLLFAHAVAAADPVLRPDMPGEVATSYIGRDPLLDSLCQFDLLVTVVSGVAADATDEKALLAVSYPNYARADNRRANQIVEPLVFDPIVRQALLPGIEDRQLAVVLELADRVARQAAQSFWGWEGYTDPAVRAFVSGHL